MPLHSVVLHCPEEPERSRALAAVLQLPLTGISPDDGALVLQWLDGRLVIRETGAGAPGPVTVDFVSGGLDYRRQYGGGELIVRACGGSQHARLRVIDATAGLGRDSFMLACHGFPVSLFERNAIVHALLADGLARARGVDDALLNQIIANMTLLEGDCIDALRTGQLAEAPVILIDPMFPPSKKSAFVKKEMRLFHQLIGPDTDGGELLSAALDRVIYRVVVKRPVKAECLGGIKPSHSLKGKAVRFDIYAKKALPA